MRTVDNRTPRLPIGTIQEAPSIFASLAPGERISHNRDGGHSVLRFRPGVPGTVHIETVRRFNSERKPVAFDADARWSMHYRITGHDCSMHKGRYDSEEAAAAAWATLSAARNDLRPVTD
jgi:hypothetical protein